MKVEFGNGSSTYGRGVVVTLTADEVALAIDAYLVAHDCHVRGPRTISTDYKELIRPVEIYVDPSGRVVHEGIAYEGNIRNLCPSSRHHE